MFPLASIYAVRFPHIIEAFKKLFILFWSIAEILSGEQQSDSVLQIRVSILPQTPLPFRLPQVVLTLSTFEGVAV